MNNGLLTRSEFRKEVFTRDKNKCVHCRQIGVDAHHLLERRLFPDGGYYLDNGVTLCADCHLDAEKTLLSVFQLRCDAKIVDPRVPDGWNAALNYDKWGNIINFDTTRSWGKLKGDEAMEKVLRAAKLFYLYS